VKRLACLALVLGVVATALTGCHEKAARTPQTEGRFFVPGYIPPGLKIETGAIQQVGPARQAFGAAIGQPAGQAFGGVILVLASQASADRQVGSTESVKPIDINGVTGRSHDDALRGAYVDWFVHGIAVAVSGPAGTIATVTDVARGLVLPADANTDNAALGPLPAGYSVITSGHFVDRDPEAGETVQVGQAPGPSFRLVGIVTGAPLLVALGGGDTVEPTKVRGHDAYISYRSRDVGAGSSRLVESVVGWLERPGIVLSIISNSSPDRLLPIAEGVRAVTEDEFRKQVPINTTTPPS
jgi:hypothetical protein